MFDSLMTDHAAGILAGIIAFTMGHVWYMWTIVKGGTKPHLFTWMLSAVMSGLTLITYRASGAQETIFVPLGDFVAFCIIAVLSWKYGNGRKFSKGDYMWLAIAIVAIILYSLLDNPRWAFYFVLIAEVVTLVPTMVKTWAAPDEEDLVAWTGTCLGNLINLFAVNQLIEVEKIYVWVILLADLVVWILILRKFFAKERGTT